MRGVGGPHIAGHEEAQVGGCGSSGSGSGTIAPSKTSPCHEQGAAAHARSGNHKKGGKPMSKLRVGSVSLYSSVALCLLLASACVTTDDAPRGEFPSPEPELPPVGVIELPDGRVRLTFPPLPPDPALQRFSVEDALRVLAEFHEALDQIDPRLLQTASREACSSHPVPVLWGRSSGKLLADATGSREPSSLERTLREQYIEHYGLPSVPLPRCLEESPLVMALRLSPRYMPAGVREGAEQLVKDPAFLAGLATSLVIYGIAWAAPEPIFTKAFAVFVTIVLTLTFTVAELTHFGMVAWASTRKRRARERWRRLRRRRSASASTWEARGSASWRMWRFAESPSM